MSSLAIKLLTMPTP
jgi:hypothetical protein